VADAQKWSGLTRLSEVFDRLRPDLMVFQDCSGREVFDLPDAPRPAEDVPAPPRFLPVFDNVLYSHSDRTRFILDQERRLLPGTAAWTAGCLLVDGRFAGTWKAGDAGVTIEACRDLSDEEWKEVEVEKEALARFVLA
jgi:hypothetical protein